MKSRQEIESEKRGKPRPDLLPPAAIAAVIDGPLAVVFAEFAAFMESRDITAIDRALRIVVAEAGTDPGVVLMAAGEIMGVGYHKHGPCTWRIARTEQADPQTHYASAVRHLLEYVAGVTADPDSGHSPLLHAICQLAIMLNLLHDPPEHPDDNDGRAMIGRPR